MLSSLNYAINSPYLFIEKLQVPIKTREYLLTDINFDINRHYMLSVQKSTETWRAQIKHTKQFCVFADNNWQSL